MKICNTCKQIKPLTEFHKDKTRKDGFRNQCKECIKEYQQINKERILERSKEYYQINKERILERDKQYRQNNKERIRERDKQYNQNNKEHRREYIKNRLQTDELFKAKTSIRTLIRRSISKMGYTKQSKTYQILGCTYEEFKLHIEQQFAPDMSWDNRELWHLDHIIPLSLGQTEEEVIALNHYTNFQPLWEEDNLSKGNNIHWEKDPNKYNTP